VGFPDISVADISDSSNGEELCSNEANDNVGTYSELITFGLLEVELDSFPVAHCHIFSSQYQCEVEGFG